MANAKVKTTAKPKSKTDQKVEQILATLKDKNIKLSMLEYSDLVNTLVSTYRIKPTVLEKKTNFSLPHIYNLICLGAMSPKMKALIVSGKIKGTDALKILRKAKNESEFIMYAHELSETKVDNRKRDEVQIQQDRSAPSRKDKVKQLILEILGNENGDRSKTRTINSLVDQLMPS
jgi:hypothetical protein